MTTNVSIMDDGYTVVTQPVVGIYTIMQPQAPLPAPLGTVDPAEDEEEVKDAKPAREAKVVSSPGKPAAKASVASEDIETK